MDPAANTQPEDPIEMATQDGPTINAIHARNFSLSLTTEATIPSTLSATVKFLAGDKCHVGKKGERSITYAGWDDATSMRPGKTSAARSFLVRMRNRSCCF